MCMSLYLAFLAWSPTRLRRFNTVCGHGIDSICVTSSGYFYYCQRAICLESKLCEKMKTLSAETLHHKSSLTLSRIPGIGIVGKVKKINWKSRLVGTYMDARWKKRDAFFEIWTHWLTPHSHHPIIIFIWYAHTKSWRAKKKIQKTFLLNITHHSFFINLFLIPLALITL